MSLITRTPEQIESLRAYAKSKNLPINIYEDFGVFMQYMVPKIKVGKNYYDLMWFHKDICSVFQGAIFDDYSLGSIEIGPQIGKSIITALAIVYILGSNPNTSIIYATYNESKAVDFNKRYIIKFMGEDKYKLVFPHIALKYELDKKDSSTQSAVQRKISTMKDNEFTLSNPRTKQNYLGNYRSFGIDQGIHGVPADIFIIDDYVSKGDNVKSETFRSKLREWFYNDMPSRLQDNSSIVMAICTRWYADDIIGMLRTSYYKDILPAFERSNVQPPKFKQLKIRAENRLYDSDKSPNDPRTLENEELWPAHLLKYSLARNGMYFNAMYNCDPAGIDGARQVTADSFYYYTPEELPQYGSLDMVIDSASTDNAASDNTSIQIWKMHGNYRYLIDLHYAKWETPELLIYLSELLETKYKRINRILVEHANSGIWVSQFLSRLDYPVIKLNFASKTIGTQQNKIEKILTKGNSKADRFFRSLDTILDHEKPIRLPKTPIKHQDEFLRQVINFTGDRHRKDDLVDCLVHYINFTNTKVINSSIDSALNFQIDGYHLNTMDNNYGGVSYV